MRVSTNIPPRRHLAPDDFLYLEGIEPFVRNAIQMDERAVGQSGDIGGRTEHTGRLHFRRRQFDSGFRTRNARDVAQVRDRNRVLFHSRGEILFLNRQFCRRRRIGFDPFGGLEQRSRRGGCRFGIFGEILPIDQDGATILVLVRDIGRLVGDVADLAVGEQQTADRLGIRHRIHLSFVQGQAELARRKHDPGDLLARVDSIGAQDAIGENERRCSHAGNTDAFAPQIFYRPDVPLCERLDPQAAAVNAAGELHIQPLFDGLEEIHDQMMRDVKSAQSQHVLVIRPFAFDERDVQSLFLEKALFDRGENGRFTSQTDIPYPDLARAAVVVVRMPVAACHEQGAQGHGRDHDPCGDNRNSFRRHDG